MSYMNNICYRFAKLNVGPSQPRYRSPPPQRQRRRRRCTVKPQPATLKPSFLRGRSRAVYYRNLHPTEPKYHDVEELIDNDSIVVENIVEVDNVYLKEAYALRKRQMEHEYGQVNEYWLFHGTKKENVDNICTYNYDWRLYQRCRFGRGVSFSKSAYYASHYSDEDSDYKVMLLNKVLVARACKGNTKVNLPPSGYDTTLKDNKGSVIVKYEDNEFHPLYKIYYHFVEDTEDDESYDDYIY